MQHPFIYPVAPYQYVFFSAFFGTIACPFFWRGILTVHLGMSWNNGRPEHCRAAAARLFSVQRVHFIARNTTAADFHSAHVFLPKHGRARGSAAHRDGAAAAGRQTTRHHDTGILRRDADNTAPAEFRHLTDANAHSVAAPGNGDVELSKYARSTLLLCMRFFFSFFAFFLLFSFHTFSLISYYH